jgi:Fungal trichothecene efflux pump (TRI12)
MFTRDPIEIGVSAMPGGLGGAVGGFLGGLLVGRGPGLGSNHILIYGSALKMLSDAVFTILTPDTFRLALGMGFLAMFGMGMSLVCLVVCVQLTSNDEHIGLATLVLGSIRAIGGSVAVTIYTSIMQNTLKEDAGPRVGKELRKHGFNVTTDALKQLVPKLLTGKELMQTNITSVTPQALQLAKDTVKWTWALAFRQDIRCNVTSNTARRIYFAAVAFSTLSLVASFFVKDVSSNMTDSVAVTLKNDGRDEKAKRVEA